MRYAETIKNPECIALMCEFMRHKRGLTQTEVADEAGISRATVAFLETKKFIKVSRKNVEHIFSALCFNKASLNDPSLYQLILDNKPNNIGLFLEKKYLKHAHVIAKVFSSVFDAYSASLNWRINLPIAEQADFYIKLKNEHDIEEKTRELLKPYPPTKLDSFVFNTGFPNYLPSIIFFSILCSFPKKYLSDIFYVDEITLEAPKNEFEWELLFYLADSKNDPFLKLMKCLNIPFVDYLGLIKKITDISSPLLTPLRMMTYENSADVFNKLLNEIFSDVYSSGNKSDKILKFLTVIDAGHEDLLKAMKTIDQHSN